MLKNKKVLELRKSGMTISEIQRVVPVSKSTISIWIDNLTLTIKAKKRIQDKITLGHMESREVLKNKSLLRKIEIDKFSKNLFNNLKISNEIVIILCSCIYEAEGGKGKSQSLTFTNSNPKMIVIFLRLLRKGFEIDESKLRACIHLHSYHNENKQLSFWSDLTDIPKKRFMKSFKKKNSGINKKEGYQGCLSLRYYDISIKNKLLSVFKELENNI